MDQGVKTKRQKNPRKNASIVSIITFFYTYPIFKKGKNLDDEDVFEILPKFTSKNLGDILEYKWKKEQTLKKNPSVWRMTISTFATYYLFLGLIQLGVKTLLIMVQPTALANVVAFFKSGQTELTKKDLYYNAALVIGLNMLSTFYNHNYLQALTEYGIKVRTSFAALIYRKALKLNLSYSDITMGKIVTLITKDVGAFEIALFFMNEMWIGFIQTIIIGYLIYIRIGSSVMSGLGFFLLVIPLQMFVSHKSGLMRLAASKKTDERIQMTTETLSAIKTIKMYAWEAFFGQKINEVRDKELNRLSNIFYLKCLVMVIGGLVSKIAFYLLIITYVWTGQYINAELVYYIQSCFINLRSYITVSIPLGIAQTAELCASIKRIQSFLTLPEIKTKNNSTISKPRVYLDHVSVTIKENELLKDVSLSATDGLILITGNVGSGKSILLKTILKDYPVNSGTIKVDGTISYASQEPWLFPSTIKQNILFGQIYNDSRYKNVLEVCALNFDLNLFEKGDQTIVGDGGTNLSKGQQARINLARAVYKNSDIYLLDDCLSSLDAHVRKYVFKHCILEFLKNKLVFLVTHDINHLKQVYGKNVLFLEDGRTLSLQQQNDTLDKRITYYMDDIDNDYFAEEKEEEDQVKDVILLDIADDSTALLNDVNTEKSELKPGQNMYYEKKAPGKVALKVYWEYYKFAGGAFVLFLVSAIFIACQASVAYSDKLVSQWVNLEPKISNLSNQHLTNTTDYVNLIDKRNGILNIYSALIFAAFILGFLRAYLNMYFCIKASKNMHTNIITSVLNSSMTFFDCSFIGNIINRFSKDLSTTDEYIPYIIFENFRCIFTLVGIMYLIVSVNVMFLIPASLLFLKLYLIRNFYAPTGRIMKRLESATKSPMIGYLNATLEGLTTVRAYDSQELLKDEFDKHQDFYTSTNYMMQCTIRAFGFVLDMVCTLFTASVVLKFVLFSSSGAKAGDVGLAITQAMMLTGLLQWSVRQVSELENNMTAVERVLEYTHMIGENKTTGQYLGFWPSQGQIEYRDVSLVYKTTKEMTLKHLSFVIEPNSKVGIVGRTGAGKSSIISTLFRLYDIEGQILIDDVDIKTLSLDFLRVNIAIIPQDPVLFTGTIRSNIDPERRYSDDIIWNAIEKVNLKNKFYTLEENIIDSGSNFSSGQKQLICLARALVSRNRIIILDEATASVDPETCELLQKAIRQHFAKCTVVTIAHRLNTVYNADKIMVVDAGEIVEYDTPQRLLDNKDGFFYKMIKKSGIEMK